MFERGELGVEAERKGRVGNEVRQGKASDDEG